MIPITQMELEIMPRQRDPHIPHYEDAEVLAEAMAEVSDIPPVTNPEQIEDFLSELAEVREGRKTFITSGPCNERVDANYKVEGIGNGYLALAALDGAIFGSKVVSAIRGRGGGTKPRSKPFEIRNGIKLPSYKGDMVNGMEFTPESRREDPMRMVAGAIQAHETEEYMTATAGSHVNAAHEALLLPYEQASMVEQDGTIYICSGDYLWLGDRTRNPYGPLAKMLRSARNPNGAKIGPSATVEDIKELSQTQNSEKIPGKFSFILRLGLDHLDKAQKLVEAMDKYAPEALIISDSMHGITHEVEGRKTRALDDSERETEAVAKACEKIGRRLNGQHLEAIASFALRQCVDTRGQVPKDDSDIDPQLNLMQKRRLLLHAAPYLL